jgi:D-glycero-alpha-D-manno-heptose 1-phosphate guanylyltransferase
MAPISGRPFLEYQMDYWIDQGVDRFIVSVGYMKEVIIDHFGESYRGAMLSYAIEERPLGTGGGLLLAAQGLDEAFLVLNGDTFFEVDLSELLEFHIHHFSDWTISLFQVNEADRYMGIDIRSDGEILSVKSAAHDLGSLANGGVYMVNPSVLNRVEFIPDHKLSLEDDLIPAFTAQGCKLYGIRFNGRFIDIGVPQDYLQTAEVLSLR